MAKKIKNQDQATVAVLAEASAAANVTRRAKESEQRFWKRVAETILDPNFDEAAWDRLSEGTQCWLGAAADAIKTRKDIPDPAIPAGEMATPPPVEEEEGDEEEPEEEKEERPARKRGKKSKARKAKVEEELEEPEEESDEDERGESEEEEPEEEMVTKKSKSAKGAKKGKAKTAKAASTKSSKSAKAAKPAKAAKETRVRTSNSNTDKLDGFMRMVVKSPNIPLESAIAKWRAKGGAQKDSTLGMNYYGTTRVLRAVIEEYGEVLKRK